MKTTVAGRELDLGFGVINDTKEGCWACDGLNALEGHHCIPRAYGGEHGPQVVICSDCHSGLHKLADANMDPVVALELFRGYSNVALTRASRLAMIVVVARDRVKNDPNKSVVFQDRFPAKTRNQLRDLAKVLARNQQQVVRIAIAALHRRYFG